MSFQSTPPYGGRRFVLWFHCSLTYSFNPRPRMGGDALASGPVNLVRGFNPRPRMGGDLPFVVYLT